MNNELMAKLGNVRHETRRALRGLNGEYDSEYDGGADYIENFRSGWAQSSLKRAMEELNELLAERDAIIYEMEQRLSANDRSNPNGQ